MQLKVNDLKRELMSKSINDKPRTFFKGIMKCILAYLVLFATVNMNAQGWDVTFGSDGEDFGEAVIQTSDLGFIVAGYSESFGDDGDLDVYVIRTDVDGREIWSNFYDEGLGQHAYKIIETGNKGFLVVGDIVENIGDKTNVYLLKISETGEREWSKTYGDSTFEERGFDIVKAKDGEGFLIIGFTNDTANGNSDILIIRIDDSGEEMWRKTFGEEKDDVGTAVVALEDGFALSARSKSPFSEINNDAVLIRVDSDGEMVWTRRLGDGADNKEANDLVLTQDDHLIYVGSSHSFKRNLIAKYDLNGEEVWITYVEQYLGNELREVIELEEGGDLVAVGYRDITPSKSAVLLSKFEKENGNLIWEKTVEGNIKSKFAEGLAATNNGGFIITGTDAQLGVFFNDVTLIRTDSEGNLITNHIYGKVYHSQDGCNAFQSGDLELPSWIVKAESESATYFGTTDENGNYDIRVDTGFYTVSLLLQNDYWSICSYEFSIGFTEFYDTTVFDFPVVVAFLCPYLAVEISSDQVRTCETTIYTVTYANYGPVTVNDPYIDVQLDEELTFISSDLPEMDLGDNLYRFDIGDDVLPTATGSFTIEAIVACEGVEDEQAITTSAHIFPDTLCLIPGDEWDGSSIYVRGECIDNNLKFYIGNRADAANMTQERASFIVEDQILFLVNPSILLDAGEEIELLNIEGNGSTYRLIAEQSEGHPGQNNPTVAIEGCVVEGEDYSTGTVTQFPENDQDYYISIDVKEAISSNSPVILRGYPKGYDNSIITPTTDLEYTIAFRNIGTDTINRLVIRDTLPAFLDRTKIRLGASSHPYEFEVYNSGVVKFTIEEIQLLPGSSAQTELSRGFVTFTIPQTEGNPMGTIIENSAAIFFDYEEPVQTNVTRHIVDCTNFFDAEESCITVDFWPPTPPGLNIKVYPNPFKETVTIELEGFEGKELKFSLLDVMGREVQAQKFTGNNYVFYRNHLPTGLYVFKLETEGKLIGSGKILVR